MIVYDGDQAFAIDWPLDTIVRLFVNESTELSFYLPLDMPRLNLIVILGI